MSKHNRGKGKGTVNPSAAVRDNKGRFIGKKKPLAESRASPTIVVDDDNNSCDENYTRNLSRSVSSSSSDLSPVPSSVGDEAEHQGSSQPETTTLQGSRPDRVPVIMYAESTDSSTMDTGPSPKRPRTMSAISSSSKETIPLLSTLRWVNEAMKTDLTEAHSKSAQEFTNCCNWWYRAILWKKKDFSKSDKDQFCQAAFGALQSQLQYNENGVAPNHEPIGIKVHRQWTKYSKQVYRELRRNFEALLLMFLESPDMKGLVDVWFGVVRESSPRGISLENPCLSAVDIRDRFFKSDMQIISDVWYPIMDVAAPNFLLDNGMWGGRFLDATCVTLAWMFTHFIRVDKAEEKLKFEVGKCPIPADLITSSIYKGDGVNTIPSDWFDFNKPKDWKVRKTIGGPCGKLKFVKLNFEAAQGLLDEEINREIADPESGVIAPRASESMKELFDIEKIEDQADYIMSVLRVRASAVRNIEVQSRKTVEELEIKAENTLRTLLEYKNNTNRPAQDIQKRMQTERFIHEAKAMFTEAQQREESQKGGMGMTMLVKDPCFTTTEILGGFASWLGLLKKEGYFNSLCNKYDSGLFTGGGYMLGGNAGYSGQVWGGMGGGYHQDNGWGGGPQVMPHMMMGGQNQPGFSGYPMLNPMQVHGQMSHGQMSHGQMSQGPMSQGPMPQGPMPQGPMPQGPMPQGPMLQGPMLQGPMPQGRVQPPQHMLGQAGESQGPVPPGQILGQMPSGQNMTANSMYQGPAQQVQGYSGQRMEQNQMRMMHHSQRAMHEQQQMGAQLGVQHSSAGYAQLNTTNIGPLTPTLMPYIQNGGHGGHGGTYGMQYSPHSQGGGMVLGNEAVAGSSINSYEQGTNVPGNVDRRSGGNDEITGMGHGQNEVGDGSMMAGGTGDVDRNRRGGENNGMGQTYGQNDGGMMAGGAGAGVVAGSGASVMGPPARPLSRTISPPNGDGAYMKENRQISDDVDSDKTV